MWSPFMWVQKVDDMEHGAPTWRTFEDIVVDMPPMIRGHHSRYKIRTRISQCCASFNWCSLFGCLIPLGVIGGFICLILFY